MTPIPGIPLDAEFLPQLLAAVACGGLIGFERQIRGKVAGMRTAILICMGTTVFVNLGVKLGADADPSRVLGQVVTGIGFLGTGVIVARGGEIIGVTTAAAIWMLAAIGSCIGVGRLQEAVALTVATLVVSVGLEWLEYGVKRVTGTLGRKQKQVED